jgi:predicted RNA-binding protein with PUA-like domain
MIVPHALAAAGEEEGQDEEDVAHGALVALAPAKIYKGRGGTSGMAHWLMKSEPASYGWDDLVRDGAAEWDGVRNPTARRHLQAMRVGDEAFFYHSGKDKAVVGILRIAREAAPDPKDAAWVSVRVEPVRRLPQAVSLQAIKAEPALAALEMLRQSRLSVSPVPAEEWQAIVGLAEQRGRG